MTHFGSCRQCRSKKNRAPDAAPNPGRMESPGRPAGGLRQSVESRLQHGISPSAALYAMKNPIHVERIVQVGAMQPFFGKQYPPDLMCMDETFAQVMSGLQQLE